jgi:glycosyltransferase involved in cell wall biosynthesis
MTKKPKFCVIVPCKEIDAWIKDKLIPSLEAQTYKNWELIIVTDKDCPGGPAKKRDWAAKKSQGEFLAFIDSDAYAHPDWLKNALGEFKNKQVAGVCGPGLLPPQSKWQERLVDWVWRTKIGAGGAGTYRCQEQKRRLVDDYPTFNFLVRNSDFKKIGGFNCSFWPGEDTKLCHDLVYKLDKKIVYTPKVKVYHRGRSIMAHLKRVWRFGVHRGYFVKILPKTSLRVGYFLPSIFLIWLLIGWIMPALYFISLAAYLILMGFASWRVFRSEENLIINRLIGPLIFLTHLVYGAGFIKGLLTRKLLQ